MAKKFEITSKEDYINEMIFDSIEHKEGFEAGFISNGKVTFNDLTGFILLKGLSQEFKDYLINNENAEHEKFVNFNNVFIKELESLDEELPFADKNYFNKKEETK